MLHNATVDGLCALRLPGMVRGPLEQREHPDYTALSFEERLAMLVDRGLPTCEPAPAACVGRPGPGPRPPSKTSTSADNVAWNVPRSGPSPKPTGSTPTTASSSSAPPDWARPGSAAPSPRPPSAAHSALYLRGPRLLDEIAIARAEGRLAHLLTHWARIDVLLVDDFLIRLLGPDQLRHARSHRRPSATALHDRHQPTPVAMWHAALGEATVADGLLDRLLEHVHRIELHGESMRRGDAGGHNHTDTSAPTEPDSQSSQSSQR